MTRLLLAALHAEHKVLAGPRALLLMVLLFPLTLALASAGDDALLWSAQEQWVRAAFAAAGVVSVLVWAERDRPYREDLRVRP